MTDCNLMDLGFQGPIFTWSNNRTAPHTVRCLLDRFCGNRVWLEFALSAVLEHLNFPGSDHVPILLCIRPRPGIRVGQRDAHGALMRIGSERRSVRLLFERGGSRRRAQIVLSVFSVGWRLASWAYVNGPRIFITTPGDA